MKNRYRSLLRQVLFGLAFPFAATVAYAQPDTSGVTSIVSAITKYNANFPAEQVHLTFDKPVYLAGDTAWFKAYVLENARHTLTSKSAKLYVELVNDSSRLIKRIVIPLASGLGSGDFVFEPGTIGGGRYTVRAYTNWMQNFGESRFFTKQIYIGNTRLAVGSKQSKPKDVAANNLTTAATNTSQIKLPAIDLQFMPEGGKLVAGMQNRIGFKAIGKDGMGIGVDGEIRDSKGNIVTTFQSVHKGMGSFYLLPLAGEKYSAVLFPQAAKPVAVNLPEAASSGIILHVNNPDSSDSIFVSVKTNGTSAVINGVFSLAGMNLGAVYYASSFTLQKGQAVMKVPKSLFPTGIAHFTLFGPTGSPMNDRLIFIDHHDRLETAITTGKPVYAPLDSIPLTIRVTDSKGGPVTGSFSLAVTDDSQVQLDSLDGNIVSTFLLSSELNGYLEEPGWYFTKGNPDAAKALDELLLTQGWVGYDWKTVFHPPATPVFAAEPDFGVRGKLTTLLNKPATGKKVTLMSAKDLLFLDTLSDKNGRFVFSAVPPRDTAAYFIQVKNEKGKAAAVGIDVEEFSPATLATFKPAVQNPWTTSGDTSLIHYLRISEQNKEEAEKAAIPANGRLLSEIKLKTRKTYVDAEDGLPHPLDAIITQQDLEKEAQKSLVDLLEEKVKGFYAGIIPGGKGAYTYYVSGHPVKSMVIDGWDVMESPLGFDSADSYKYLKGILTYVRASDVKNITLYHLFLNGEGGKPPQDIAKIIITTRSGGGPIIPKSPGIYVYRPPYLTVQRQFYAPKYAVKDKSIADLRSTLHWEPNVITDSAGNACIYFYAASGAGTYTVRLEGTDGNGKFGQKITTVKIWQ